jgi:hypothetical protein
MKKLKARVYQQIAMNLIGAGFEGMDIAMVEEIHRDMQRETPQKPFGMAGGYARDMLSDAEQLPSCVECE